MKHPRYSVLAAVAIILASACQECTAQANITTPLTDTTPILHVTAVPMEDSAWAWVRRCSGVEPQDSFPLSRVHWFIGDLTAHSRNHNLIGYWSTPDTVILDIRFASDFTTTAHELLHYLLQHGGHPLTPWATPCDLLNEDEIATQRHLDSLSSKPPRAP